MGNYSRQLNHLHVNSTGHMKYAMIFISRDMSYLQMYCENFTNQKSKKHFLIYTTKSNKFIKIVIKGHSELTQTSKREISVKVVNSLKLLM